MVKNCLELLHKNYRCKLFPPVEEELIAKFERVEEYYRLLQLTNGLVCSGVEIFGATTVERSGKGYCLPDVETMTERFLKYEFFQDKLVIGQAPEMLIYYEMSTARYGLCSRINFFEQKSFDSLLSLLNFFFPI